MNDKHALCGAYSDGDKESLVFGDRAGLTHLCERLRAAQERAATILVLGDHSSADPVRHALRTIEVTVLPGRPVRISRIGDRLSISGSKENLEIAAHNIAGLIALPWDEAGAHVLRPYQERHCHIEPDADGRYVVGDEGLVVFPAK